MSNTNNPDDLFDIFEQEDRQEQNSSNSEREDIAEQNTHGVPPQNPQQTETTSRDGQPAVGSKRPAERPKKDFGNIKRVVYAFTTEAEGDGRSVSKREVALSNLRQASHHTDGPQKRLLLSVVATAIKFARQRAAADVASGRSGPQNNATSETVQTGEGPNGTQENLRAGRQQNVQEEEEHEEWPEWVTENVLRAWKNAVAGGLLDISKLSISQASAKTEVGSLPSDSVSDFLRGHDQVYLCYNGLGSYFVDAEVLERKLRREAAAASWGKNTPDLILLLGFLALKEHRRIGNEGVLPPALRERCGPDVNGKVLSHADFRTKGFKEQCYGKTLNNKFSNMEEYLGKHGIDLERAKGLFKPSKEVVERSPVVFYAQKCIQQGEEMIVHSSRALIDGFNLRMMYKNCTCLQDFFCVPSVERESYAIEKLQKHGFVIAKLAMAVFISRNWTARSAPKSKEIRGFFHFGRVANSIMEYFNRSAAREYDDEDREAFYVALGLAAVASSCAKSTGLPERYRQFVAKVDGRAIANFRSIGLEMICNSTEEDSADHTADVKNGAPNFVVRAAENHMVYIHGRRPNQEVLNKDRVEGGGWGRQRAAFQREIQPTSGEASKHFDVSKNILCCSTLAPSALKLAEHATDPALLTELGPPGDAEDGWVYNT